MWVVAHDPVEVRMNGGDAVSASLFGELPGLNGFA